MVEHATAILSAGTSVSEVARALGYLSSGSFVTAIRRATGFLPSEIKLLGNNIAALKNADRGRVADPAARDQAST